MKVKLNNRRIHRKSTLGAALLSAMGAWFILNNHSALGLSDFATALIVGYNTLAYILLYSIFGPRKPSAQKIFASHQSHLLPVVELKTNLRTLQKNLTKTHVDLKIIKTSLQNTANSKCSSNLEAFAPFETFLDNIRAIHTRLSKFDDLTHTDINELQINANHTQTQTHDLLKKLEEIFVSQEHEINSLSSKLHAQSEQIGDFSKRFTLLVQSSHELKSTGTALLRVMSDLKLQILRSKIRVSNGHKDLDFQTQIESLHQVIGASQELIAAKINNFESFNSDFYTLVRKDLDNPRKQDKGSHLLFKTSLEQLKETTASCTTHVNNHRHNTLSCLQDKGSLLADLIKDTEPLKTSIASFKQSLSADIMRFSSSNACASQNIDELLDIFDQMNSDLTNQIAAVNLDQWCRSSNSAKAENNGTTNCATPEKGSKMHKRSLLTAKAILIPKLKNSKAIVAQGLSKIENFSKILDAPASKPASSRQPSLEPDFDATLNSTNNGMTPEVYIPIEGTETIAAKNLKHEPMLILDKEL